MTVKKKPLRAEKISDERKLLMMWAVCWCVSMN
jgi:hypothetical protein